ncbi:hypothetical protein [Dongia deserti]|nr:hypothetical protein [Dongia deserti]
MSATLTFHGAAGTVTGSHYVLETPTARIAVVAACSKDRKP